MTDLARDHRVESALLFNFPEVNAIVCIGGNDTRWRVPRVRRVIAANNGLAEALAGPFEIDSLNVVGAANQQGASRLTSPIYEADIEPKWSICKPTLQEERIMRVIHYLNQFFGGLGGDKRAGAFWNGVTDPSDEEVSWSSCSAVMRKLLRR